MTKLRTQNPPGDSERTVPVGRVVVWCLAILSIAAAVLQFAVASENFEAHWSFGVLALVAAWLQVMWAVAVIVRTSRSMLWAGAVLNAGVVVAELATHPDGNGVQNGLCLAVGAVVAAGCGWLLAVRADHPVRRQRLVTVPASAGVVAVAVLGVALATGTPAALGTSAHDTSARGTGAQGTGGSSASRAMPGMNMSGVADSSIKLANDAPAGDITVPDTNMQMMVGMRMADSKACTATPTKAQEAAAVSMVNTSWNDAKKYQSLAAAKAAGYLPITPPGAPVVHYLNVAYYQAVLKGGPVLNYQDPQSLVYANTPNGAVLVAAMYITSYNGPTPQPGGCLTQWHVHTNLCLTGSLDVVGAVGPGQSTCPPGSVNKVTPAMIHVWFVPIPGGPTAIDAPDPQVVHAAEQVHAPVNGTA
jgi:hypothetical protein